MSLNVPENIRVVGKEYEHGRLVTMIHHTVRPKHFCPRMDSHFDTELYLPFGFVMRIRIAFVNNLTVIRATHISVPTKDGIGWKELSGKNALLGTSRCCEEDTWNYETGVQVARERFMVALGKFFMKRVEDADESFSLPIYAGGRR